MDALIPAHHHRAPGLLNALFVAAEFAIVGAPRAAIERRAQQGSGVARTGPAGPRGPAAAGSLHRHGAARHHARQPRPRHVRRARAGRLASPISFEARRRRRRWIAAHTVASVTAVAVLTYLHIVLGEMIPKSLALQSAERTVLWITPLMRAIKFGVYPLVIALNAARQRAAAARRHRPPRRIERSPLFARGARADRRRERGGRPAARRGRPDAARAVRVRRPHGARGDGAARPGRRHRARRERRRRSAASSPAGPHTRYPGLRRRPRSHRRLRPHQGAGRAGRRRARRHRRRRVRPIPHVPETAPLDDVLAHAAPPARADGGGVRRARRHGRRDHARGSVRRSRGRHPRRHRRAAEHRPRRRGRLHVDGHRAHRARSARRSASCSSTPTSTASAAWC